MAKEKKGVKPSNPATKTVARPVGLKTGLGIQAAWVHIFVQNEKGAKKNKLTDAEITNWMETEFPSRKSKVFGMVASVRNKYNKGGLTKHEVPDVISTKREDSK